MVERRGRNEFPPRLGLIAALPGHQIELASSEFAESLNQLGGIQPGQLADLVNQSVHTAEPFSGKRIVAILLRGRI